jgi:hypothetical protein
MTLRSYKKAREEVVTTGSPINVLALGRMNINEL